MYPPIRQAIHRERAARYDVQRLAFMGFRSVTPGDRLAVLRKSKRGMSSHGDFRVFAPGVPRLAHPCEETNPGDNDADDRICRTSARVGPACDEANDGHGDCDTKPNKRPGPTPCRSFRFDAHFVTSRLPYVSRSAHRTSPRCATDSSPTSNSIACRSVSSSSFRLPCISRSKPKRRAAGSVRVRWPASGIQGRRTNSAVSEGNGDLNGPGLEQLSF
jgi:hypothetical protein